MLTALKEATNKTHTTNGAVTHVTSQSYLLDFFAQGGAMRTSSDNDICQVFSKAYAENPEYALKTLFLHRDVREGNGERRLFRVITAWLAEVDAPALEALIPLIAEYGRFDDVVALLGTNVDKTAGEVIAKQLSEDVKNLGEGNPISLLAKWLPSENASSKKTKKLAWKLIHGLGIHPKQYRKTLVALRKKINLLETNMSKKQWDNVDYSSVPSQAMMKYRQAFYRNDEDGFTDYLDSLVKGDKGVKVNAGALYPYQIVEKILGGDYYVRSSITPQDRVLYDQQWKALPNRIEGAENSLAVVDTSGSMSGTPMNVAISLGMYVAERNEGAFHNHFMTFSSRPQLVEIVGKDIVEKVSNMSKANWDMSTNLEAVFNLILDTAVRKNMPQSQMPIRLFIVSDMQFDSAVRLGSNELTFFQTMRAKFAQAGYALPKLVFWNVNARMGQSPVEKDTPDVQLVSGFSQNLFKAIMESSSMNPYDMMIETLNSDRYEQIKYIK